VLTLINLKDRGLGYDPYDDMGSALKDLVLSKIDALVGEKPVLHHRIAQSHGEELTVVPDHFQWEAHAFALPPGSALRESLNRQLLKIMASDKREKIIKRYLGEY
jgi:polar amino acid transport system substrate-binding protein